MFWLSEETLIVVRRIDLGTGWQIVFYTNNIYCLHKRNIYANPKAFVLILQD
jgi:hypothetical protein